MFGLATMGTKDGAQGVTMTGVSKYGEELRVKVLEEALKGERFITDIAEEYELLTNTIRDWLKRHYETNPGDPRRHKIERESERYKRGEKAETEMATAAVVVPEEATHRLGALPHPKRDQVMAALEGGMSPTDAALQFGVAKGTVYSWSAKLGGYKRTPNTQKPEKKQDEREVKAWALYDQGKDHKTVRDELKLNGKVAKRFRLAWQENQKSEARKAQLEAARAARVEKARLRRESGESQQELPMPRSETTMLSSPGSVVQLRRPAPPSTGIVQMPTQQQGVAMVEMFQECVEERSTLRGMVGILQRENESMKKKLDVYRRMYGEIQQ